MYLRSDQFCHIATSPVWLNWLYEYSKELYEEFTTNMRKRPGCGENRRQMLEIVRKITDDPEGSTKLLAFLGKKFPKTLQERPEGLPVNKLQKPAYITEVFGYHDPTLMTIPRRTIVSNDDKATLERLIQQVISDKAASDHVIVGNQAYIEYIPASMSNIVNKIPESNWLIKAWRQKQAR